MTGSDQPAPLDGAVLARALVVPGGLWSSVRVVPATGSTNADLRAAALADAPEGTVLVAEEQSAGRGRLGRAWECPPRAGLTFSVLLRPRDVPAARWSWLPLLTGVAVAQALREHAGVGARLKWPNDVLVGDRKLAGVLVERVDDLDHADGPAAILGVGVNVSQTAEELPATVGTAPPATSLLLEGAPSLDREALLRAMLHELAGRYADWRVAGGSAEASGLREAYLSRSATSGKVVRVVLPGNELLDGEVVDIDAEGRLVVVPPAAEAVHVAAGDVVHVR